MEDLSMASNLVMVIMRNLIEGQSLLMQILVEI
jgi:hypothetical protein